MRDHNRDKFGGFSTTPRSVSGQPSWEAVNQPPPLKPVGIDRTYPKSDLQKPSVDTHKFWSKAEGGTPGGRKPDHQGGDLGKYSKPLPRYTDPKRARDSYQSGDKFDPKQTLFRYDPDTLNRIAENRFRNDRSNDGKPFIPPHDPRSPVYEGLLKRKGADGLGRVYSSDLKNKEGGYLFDLRNAPPGTQESLTKILSRSDTVAFREYYSIPNPVNAFTHVSSKPWDARNVSILSREELEKRAENTGTKVNYSGTVMTDRIQMSRTLGGGEQIFGERTRSFKFFD